MDKTDKLRKIFLEQKVLRRSNIFKALGTSSWTTAYRQLKKIGYIASFTHTCSYYTLKEIPTFDDQGIWFFGEVGFSNWGNLQNSIKNLVQVSEKGKTHEEIQQQLRTRAYNALQKLTESNAISREKTGGVYVYFNLDPDVKKIQLDKRRKNNKVKSLPRALVIDILVQTLHLTVGLVNHIDVAKSLRRRGIKVTNEQVCTVFKQYGLEKKTLD